VVTLFLGAALALEPPRVARVTTTFMAAMQDMVEGGGCGEGRGRWREEVSAMQRRTAFYTFGKVRSFFSWPKPFRVPT